jgi:dTDP-glucose 4,6-dehydratase
LYKFIDKYRRINLPLVRIVKNNMKNILVTGACGFIGSHFCRLLQNQHHTIFVVDKLTYASNIKNIADVSHRFFHCSIGNKEFVSHILHEYQIDGIVNFAAESHVDSSITNPDIFIQTNIVETHNLVSIVLEYQKTQKQLRFVHISTDEVFGDLNFQDPKFTENTPYKPSSPYSSSKAASDHIVHSAIRTFGLNGIITNCSNNYGTMQNSEKLIPKIINLCLNEKPLTIYGSGNNIRDWIHVEDHCYGIYLALTKGKIGESYCFGGNCEVSVKNVVYTICSVMNRVRPRKLGKYEDLIVNVEDRKGHDLRYAIDDTKAQTELGFTRQNHTFEENIEIIIKSLF